MDGNAVIALIGGAVVAFIIRIFNVVVEWLSRVLGVEPPEAIPTVVADDVERGGTGSAPPADRPPQGTTGANPGTSEPTTG